MSLITYAPYYFAVCGICGSPNSSTGTLS